MDASEIAVRAESVTDRVKALLSSSEKSWSWKGEGAEHEASFFAMKTEMLLAYCLDLSFYMRLKASSPSSVKDHAVLDRLFEQRLVLEKTRLVEAKLRHELERILSRREAATEATATSEFSRPDPGALVAPEETEFYRPPKLAAARFEKEEEEAKEEYTSRSRRNEMLEVVRENDAHYPEHRSNVVGGGGGAGRNAAKRERLAREERDRTRFEESRFIRVEQGKKQKKKRKMMHSLSGTLDDLV